MKLVIAGCEYAGKTTLVSKIRQWISDTMGGQPGVHDHFTIPNLAHRELTDEEVQQVLALSPALKEEFLRYIISYHLSPSFMNSPDHLLVGFHIEEAVYAPMYWDYGRKGEYAYRSTLAQVCRAGAAGEGPGHDPRPAEGLSGSDQEAHEGESSPARHYEGRGRGAVHRAFRRAVRGVIDSPQDDARYVHVHSCTDDARVRAAGASTSDGLRQASYTDEGTGTGVGAALSL